MHGMHAQCGITGIVDPGSHDVDRMRWERYKERQRETETKWECFVCFRVIAIPRKLFSLCGWKNGREVLCLVYTLWSFKNTQR